MTVPIDKVQPESMRVPIGEALSLLDDDLTRDERLAELLVDEVVLGAARWWNRALERAG